MCATPVEVGETANVSTTTIGDSGNTWGNALTLSWVQNSNFGVALGYISGTNNSDIYVDYVTLAVEYTVPSKTTTQCCILG